MFKKYRKRSNIFLTIAEISSWNRLSLQALDECYCKGDIVKAVDTCNRLAVFKIILELIDHTAPICTMVLLDGSVYIHTHLFWGTPSSDDGAKKRMRAFVGAVCAALRCAADEVRKVFDCKYNLKLFTSTAPTAE